MRYLLSGTVAVCAAVLITTGCSDTTEPLGLEPLDGFMLASTGETEVYRWWSTGQTITYNPPLTVREPHRYPHTDLLFPLVRYGDSQPSEYAGASKMHCPAVMVKYEWLGTQDYGYRGVLCSIVEKGSGHRYDIYHLFLLYECADDDPYCSNTLAPERKELGSVLARQWLNCRKLPCDVSQDAEILYATGKDVFAPGKFSGNLYTSNSTLSKYVGDLTEHQGEVLFYTWLSGNGTWTEAGDPVDPVDPGDPGDALLADFAYSCQNTATCTFTDLTTSTGAISSWSWSWEFDNATPPMSNDPDPTTTFNKDGNNRVTLTVTANGVSDHHTKSIYCRSHPQGFRCR